MINKNKNYQKSNFKWVIFAFVFKQSFDPGRWHAEYGIAFNQGAPAGDDIEHWGVGIFVRYINI